MRIGVVDLGTNSTRLLVAEADPATGTLTELVRRTDVTRLGDGVDTSGRLADDAMERVYATLEEYRGLLDEHEAERTVAVATSAVRDAANGEQFRAKLAERYGLDARTISGEEEARLTFLGATAGRPAASEDHVVIDIGGGSTELVVGRPGQPPAFHTSTQAGSVRHTERHLHSDPPTATELANLRDEVRDIIGAAMPPAADAGIAVAGTATSLAAIDLELEPHDPDMVHGHALARERCEELLAVLAAMPVAERRNIAGLLPARAPTIVAGAAILSEAIAAFELGSVEVSETDILHGAARDAALRAQRR